MLIGARQMLALTVSLASITALLPAQGETTSAIVGAVVDPSGAAVANAAVTANSTETGWKRKTITDDAGRFSFPQLKPGSYTLSVDAPGFEPQITGSVA